MLSTAGISEIHQKFCVIKMSPAEISGLPADDQARYCNELALPSVALPSINTVLVLTFCLHSLFLSFF